MKHVTWPQALVIVAALGILIASPLVLRNNPEATAVASGACGLLLAFTRSLIQPPPEDKK